MLIHIPAFANGALIPEQYAFGRIDSVQHVVDGDNKNPQIIWQDVPENAQSLVLLCVDDKVPTVFSDANKADVTISKTLPRMDFYHWVLIDIDPKLGEIAEGQDADGVVAEGKSPGKKAHGLTGVNSYSQQHGGYDGPCPPWNDELMHEYHFRLYALDVPALGLSGHFTGPEVLAAMEGHVIAIAEWMGVYTLNPKLRK